MSEMQVSIERMNERAATAERYHRLFTLGEFHIFLGILFAMTRHQTVTHVELWSVPQQDDPFGVDYGFKKVMPFARFNTWKRYLCLPQDDPSETAVVNHWRKNKRPVALQLHP